jgi:hypothetical protein
MLPHAVYFDEEQKSLVVVTTFNGETFTSVIQRAGEPTLNNNVYTEDCLRSAAKQYMEQLTGKRLHSETDITVLS